MASETEEDQGEDEVMHRAAALKQFATLVLIE